jgi:ribonuclease E
VIQLEAHQAYTPAAVVTDAAVAPEVQPQVVSAAPVAEVAVPVAVPAPAHKAPAAAETVAAAAMPKVTQYALPQDDLIQVAQSSGLQWVNTNADSVAKVQAAIAAEPQPVHVPRERPAPVTIDAGPLVLVETKRDLRNLTLPFEETTPS